MTASAPSSPRPGRAAPAGHPVGALLVLLIVALLTMLPCAGQAKALDGSAHPVPAPAPVSAVSVISVEVATGQAPHSGHAAQTTRPARAAKLAEPEPEPEPRTEPRPGAEPATGKAAKAAQAAKATQATQATKPSKASEHHRIAEDQGHWILCTADGEPPRNNGCSSHPFCPQDAQLPNPPPHPQPAVTPVTQPAPEALPRVAPAGLLDGSHPVPDLHELQVHRS
ncbi:hypothetical protein ACFQ6N_21535 [Kitasatospora sp. NPDC056446]|uniref:hypothetical protein n=1 Tax=Kitasatospora sp. NPDC056446 TaxID=3345819 RepID=UPI0036B83F5D